MEKKDVILKIENMSISFSQYEKGCKKRQRETIQSLSLEVEVGEVVAVVGASGAGKSLLAHAILGLLPYNAIVGGHIYYKGEELSQKRIEHLRGTEIVMVPQNLSYLDPLMKVGTQIRKGKKDAVTRQRLRDIFHRYSLKEEVEDMYPFEISGGMSRRILVSTALMEDAGLVIADEPTPGLELKLAKRVMGHFRELADRGAGVIVITHDLELATETADRIVVFYDGNTVEETLAENFRSGNGLRHPYSKALFEALIGNGFGYQEKEEKTDAVKT